MAPGSRTSSPLAGSMNVVLKFKMISTIKTRSISESIVFTSGLFNSSGSYDIEMGMVSA